MYLQGKTMRQDTERAVLPRLGMSHCPSRLGMSPWTWQPTTLASNSQTLGWTVHSISQTLGWTVNPNSKTLGWTALRCWWNSWTIKDYKYWNLIIWYNDKRRYISWCGKLIFISQNICQMAQSLVFFLSNLQCWDISLCMGPYLKGECMNQKTKSSIESHLVGDQNEIWVIDLCRVVLEEFDENN